MHKKLPTKIRAISHTSGLRSAKGSCKSVQDIRLEMLCSHLPPLALRAWKEQILLLLCCESLTNGVSDPTLGGVDNTASRASDSISEQHIISPRLYVKRHRTSGGLSMQSWRSFSVVNKVLLVSHDSKSGEGAGPNEFESLLVRRAPQRYHQCQSS